MKKLFVLTLSVVLFVFIQSCGEGESSSCDVPEDLSYTNGISTVIETNCFACHAPDVYKKKAARMKIFDYASLKKAAESGVLMGSVKHEQGFIAMPYRKGVKIDQCDIDKLQAWVDSGCKE